MDLYLIQLDAHQAYKIGVSRKFHQKLKIIQKEYRTSTNLWIKIYLKNAFEVEQTLHRHFKKEFKSVSYYSNGSQIPIISKECYAQSPEILSYFETLQTKLTNRNRGIINYANHRN